MHKTVAIRSHIGNKTKRFVTSFCFQNVHLTENKKIRCSFRPDASGGGLKGPVDVCTVVKCLSIVWSMRTLSRFKKRCLYADRIQMFTAHNHLNRTLSTVGLKSYMHVATDLRRNSIWLDLLTHEIICDVQVAVFWVVTLCSIIMAGYRRFGGPRCLHLQDELNGTWKSTYKAEAVQERTSDRITA